MNRCNVAVVGATGAVGRSMLALLEERDFPVDRVAVVASARSAGQAMTFEGQEVVVEDLADFDFSNYQVGLFSPGASVSAQYAPKAAAAGCVVIDNTSQFRYEDDIPLVVPECNPERIADYTSRGIIANPNCSTIQMVVALKPLQRAAGIRRVNVCTYQAVSGSGLEAMQALRHQAGAILQGQAVEPEVYPKPIGFNCLPHIDTFQDNGYTKEEMKMVWETRKILEDDSIAVNPTAVRVPVFNGHSEAVHVETARKLPIAEAMALLADAPGVTLLDERADGGYPTALTEADGHDDVYVGRVREDISHPNGINLWVVADNLRKGAALNSVQIAEILVKDYL